MVTMNSSSGSCVPRTWAWRRCAALSRNDLTLTNPRPLDLLPGPFTRSTQPDPGLFQAALDQARFWVDDLQADEVLHIGDSLESDFCGARAFGFQSLRLDRSENPRVTQYQDWLDAPDYPGKTQEDIDAGTVKDFDTVRKLLSGQLTNH